MAERLVRIVAPHFVAGVVVGKRAAPIVKYMVGWNLERIRAYCASKGWKSSELPAEKVEGR